MMIAEHFFFDVRFSTIVSWVNIAWFTIACCVAVWASTGSTTEHIRWTRVVKAVFAAMYALGILWDQTSLTTNEWQQIARFLGMLSIPLVWILPDFVAMRARTEVITMIDTKGKAAAKEIEDRHSTVEADDVLERIIRDAPKVPEATVVTATKVLTDARQAAAALLATADMAAMVLVETAEQTAMALIETAADTGRVNQ